MIFPESWKRRAADFYAHHCTPSLIQEKNNDISLYLGLFEKSPTVLREAIVTTPYSEWQVFVFLTNYFPTWNFWTTYPSLVNVGYERPLKLKSFLFSQIYHASWPQLSITMKGWKNADFILVPSWGFLKAKPCAILYSCTTKILYGLWNK